MGIERPDSRPASTASAADWLGDLEQSAADFGVMPVPALATGIAPSSDLRCGGRTIVGNQAAFGLALKAAETRQGRIK